MQSDLFVGLFVFLFFVIKCEQKLENALLYCKDNSLLNRH